MILDRSTWRPSGEARPVPVAAASCGPPRRRAPSLPAAAPDARQLAVVPRPAARPASPTDRTCPIAGTSQDGREHPLAHADSRSRALEPDRLGRSRSSSPARSAASRTRRSVPGLYGDGDASDDRSRQRWMIYAIDKRTGKIVWERVAHEGEPLEQAPHQVHLRQRDAGHRRPHRRRVVRIAGRLRLRRRRQLPAGRSISAASTWAPTTFRRTSGGRPARRSSGTASSSCSATRRPIRSCSRSNAETGETVWKTRARRAAVVGHADGRDDAGRARARDQRVELHPRLRSAHRQGAVAARRQLEDHGADADLRATACSSSRAAARRSGRSSSCGPARAATSRSREGETQQRGDRLEPDRPRLRTCRRRSSTTACSTCWPTTACSTPTT